MHTIQHLSSMYWIEECLSVKSLLGRGLFWTLILVALLERLAGAAEPRIDVTNKFQYVELHFRTPIEATRTYYLQYASMLPCVTNQLVCPSNSVVASTNWSNMATGFSYPFFEFHYFYHEFPTNRNRCYRLLVKP